MGSKAEQVYACTKNKLDSLIRNPAGSKAVLAELRKGLGKRPGEIPKLWGILFSDMPEEMFSKGREASKEEWAVYIALTLFASHQQGHSIEKECMYSVERPLGRALAMLVTRNEGTDQKEEREREANKVIQKFNAMATTDEISGLSYHLRNVISLLSSRGISLDYADLAKDLYRYQFDDGAFPVRLKWGQDLYRELNNYNKKEESK